MPDFNPNKSKYIKQVDFGAFGITLCLALMLCTTFVFVLTFPNVPPLLGNVLPTNTIYLVPLIYIYPQYVAFYGYINFAIIIVSVYMLGMIYIPLVVAEFRVGRKNYDYDTLDILRHPNNITDVYRAVEMLQNRFNELAGKLLLPFQTIATLLFVLSGYCLIRKREEMVFVELLILVTWVIGAPLIWGLFLTMSGYFHSNGNKILSSWKRYDWGSKQNNRYMCRFRKLCQPMKICNGKMFVIRKISLMVFIRGLPRGLLRALLTSKA